MYEITYARAAAKELESQTPVVARRLRAAINKLAEDPHPPGSLKMAGVDDQWRIRVGDWRVVYQIEDERLVVYVIAVRARGGVYKGRGRKRG